MYQEKDHPWQHVNEFRKDGELGYFEPKEEDEVNRHNCRIRRHADPIVDAVMNTIYETFGRAGMKSLQQCNPSFAADLRASVKETYISGHHEGWQGMFLQQGEEASKRTFSMVSALLTSATNGEDEKTTMVRALAAHAGVDQETVDNSPLIQSE